MGACTRVRGFVLVCLFALGGLLAAPALLCPAAGASAAKAGLTAHQVAGIDRFVSRCMRAGRIPGLGLAIVRSGRPVLVKGYGVADTSGRRVSSSTPFGLGSITKTFTALAIRQLAAEGKVDPEAPVARYIPWFRTADPRPDWSRITVADCVWHRSGLSRADGQLSDLYDPSHSLEQNVRLLATVHLAHSPGGVEEYSNANYLVLGLIVERVSHMPYGKYIETRIIHPMGLNHTFTDQRAAEAAGMTRGWVVRFGFAVPDNLTYPKGHVPAGFIISSPSDMAQYMLAYLSGGYHNGISLIANNPIAVTRPGDGFTMNYYDSYWTPSHTYPGGYRDSYGHSGAWANNHATLMLMPRVQTGIVVLTNVRSDTNGPALTSDDVAHGIADILSGAPAPPATDHGLGLRYLLCDAVCLLTIAGTVARLRRLGARCRRAHCLPALEWLWAAVVELVWPTGLLLAWRYAGPDYGNVLILEAIALLASGAALVVAALLPGRKRTGHALVRP